MSAGLNLRHPSLFSGIYLVLEPRLIPSSRLVPVFLFFCLALCGPDPSEPDFASPEIYELTPAGLDQVDREFATTELVFVPFEPAPRGWFSAHLLEISRGRFGTDWQAEIRSLTIGDYTNWRWEPLLPGGLFPNTDRMIREIPDAPGLELFGNAGTGMVLRRDRLDWVVGNPSVLESRERGQARLFRGMATTQLRERGRSFPGITIVQELFLPGVDPIAMSENVFFSRHAWLLLMIEGSENFLFLARSKDALLQPLSGEGGDWLRYNGELFEVESRLRTIETGPAGVPILLRGEVQLADQQCSLTVEDLSRTRLTSHSRFESTVALLRGRLDCSRRSFALGGVGRFWSDAFAP